MRIVFLGTPDFAVKSLDALVRNGYEVIAVVTQPDKPKGRGNVMQTTPVKDAAVGYGIPVLQFEKIRLQGVEPLTALKPDIMVTCAYGQILSQNILDIAPRGIINVHASLLPKYRGAAPIQWAVINGDKETGVTIMQTEAGVDTGDILHVVKTPIGECETAGELFDRLSVIGGEALVAALKRMESGEISPTPQNHAEATHVKMLDKSVGKIDWTKDGASVCNLIRGVNPWPGATTLYGDKVIKVWSAEPVSCDKTGLPGEVLSSDRAHGIVVCCGAGAVKLLELQEPGGKRLSASAYLLGNKIETGSVLKLES